MLAQPLVSNAALPFRNLLSCYPPELDGAVAPPTQKIGEMGCVTRLKFGQRVERIRRDFEIWRRLEPKGIRDHHARKARAERVIRRDGLIVVLATAQDFPLDRRELAHKLLKGFVGLEFRKGPSRPTARIREPVGTPVCCDRALRRIAFQSMCGRFTKMMSWQELHDLAELIGSERPIKPRYNIAPGSEIEVIRPAAEGRYEMTLMRWGLIPAWWKKPLSSDIARSNRHSPAYSPASGVTFQP